MKWKQSDDGIDWIDKFSFPDDFAEKIEHSKPIRKTFRSYVGMANWLEEHPEFTNCVMLVRDSKELGLSRRVRTNGSEVWVEGRGNI